MNSIKWQWSFFRMLLTGSSPLWNHLLLHAVASWHGRYLQSSAHVQYFVVCKVLSDKFQVRPGWQHKLGWEVPRWLAWRRRARFIWPHHHHCGLHTATWPSCVGSCLGVETAGEQWVWAKKKDVGTRYISIQEGEKLGIKHQDGRFS